MNHTARAFEYWFASIPGLTDEKDLAPIMYEIGRSDLLYRRNRIGTDEVLK